MGTSGLPDIYTLSPQHCGSRALVVYIRQLAHYIVSELLGQTFWSCKYNDRTLLLSNYKAVSRTQTELQVKNWSMYKTLLQILSHMQLRYMQTHTHAHTHTDVHTETSLRNQAHAWFKKNCWKEK